MKVLIIDDARLARNELKRLIKAYPEIELCGEAANADEARKAIKNHNPELLLLDIQIPDEDGFELLESLDKVPEVIFTTAYHEFALKAFEKNAVDYLMKPIDPERLDEALKRVDPKSNFKETEKSDQLDPDDKVFVKDGEKCWFIVLKEIRYFETYGNYSKIYFKDEKALVHKSLNYLDSRLSPKTFFRANRQHIINLGHIKQIHLWGSGTFRVEMSCGNKIDISRRRSQTFKELLSF